MGASAKPYVFALVAGALVGALLLGLPGRESGPSRVPPLDKSPDPAVQAAAQEYAASIQALAMAAGSITELEMKPGIRDIEERAYEEEILQGFADRWAADFARLREDLAATRPPAGAEEAHEVFLDSLDGYRRLALLLSDASTAPDPEREDLLQEAIALGNATDQVWNRARDLLATHLRTLNLDPSQWLPVPP